jgi:hypothetical protein
MNELHLSCESGVCDTLLTIVQKISATHNLSHFYQHPSSWRFEKQKHPISVRAMKLNFDASCDWNGPSPFSNITHCFLLPIVTSPWQWKLKCCLIMVHLHVSLTTSWCTNLSYHFRLTLFFLADPLILESPKVPLTYISCMVDKSSPTRLVTYHIISMNYQLYPSTHNHLQGGHHHWGWISNQPIVNSRRYGPPHLCQPMFMKSQYMWCRFNIVLPLASCYWIAQFGCNLDATKFEQLSA